MGRLLLVVGIVGASSLKFSNYQFDGQNYLKVEVDDGSLKCPKTGKLAAQYNLGSVLIPGVSPLAYREKEENVDEWPYVWNDPATSTSALPKWWQRNQDPGRAQYRLRSETDSILATGLFIPEMELDGEYWSATSSKNESGDTAKNRGDGFAGISDCIAGKRPTEADIEDGVYAIADLEHVQSYIASLWDTGGWYERPYDDRVVAFDICFAFIGNITGYK